MTECIRIVDLADSKEILELYAPFIENTDISFEYTVPDEYDFTDRIKSIADEYPYLVYEKNGKILGYAYAHRYLERAAYQWDVEVTIYLGEEAQKQGIGKKLYAALEEMLLLQGIKNLYACITASNTHSIAFHNACGYKLIGTFAKTGYKHGKWHDVVWMEKALGIFEDIPSAPVKFSLLNANDKNKILQRYLYK